MVAHFGIGKHAMRCGYLLVMVFALISSAATAQAPQVAPPTINVMPMPATLTLGAGRLMVPQTFSVAIAGYNEPKLERAAQRFLRDLGRETGYFLNDRLADAGHATLVIHADHGSEPVQDLGEDESYILDVSSAGAKLTAPNPIGVMRGLQTFLQLVEVTPDGYAVPAVHIEDSPRFPWRGLSIDVSRHFISMATLKRNVDAMAAVKMNVLHLHLSDDQGFSEAAGTRLRRHVLYAKRDARADCFRRRPRDSHRAGIRYAGAQHGVVRGLSGTCERPGTIPD